MHHEFGGTLGAWGLGFTVGASQNDVGLGLKVSPTRVPLL